MTIGRLVTWMMVWISGWALFFVRPVGHSSLGGILLLIVAPLIMATPREWRDVSIRSGAIVLVLLVCLFLILVFVLPPSFSWQYPTDPWLLGALEVFGVLIAVCGIGVTSRRFIRDHADAA